MLGPDPVLGPSGNREFPSGSIELGSGSRMQYEGEARKAVVEELVTMTAKLLADGHYQESAALIVQGLSLAPNSTELLALKAVVEQITQAHRNGGEESLSAVDRVLKTLKEANIAFNAPAELRVHETATIHLLLDATRDAEELEVMLTGEEKETAQLFACRKKWKLV